MESQSKIENKIAAPHEHMQRMHTARSTDASPSGRRLLEKRLQIMIPQALGEKGKPIGQICRRS